jgi:Tfp pilus assembly protein PilV
LIPMPTRVRDEAGMGLVELLAALMILNIAILVIIAAFSSGMFALREASRKATAATLADVEMERLRAIRYCDIRIAPADGCAESPEPATPASIDRTGADGRTYRVETTIVEEQPVDASGPVASARDVKVVTMVVHDPADGKLLTRQSSTFDEGTG